MKEPSPVLMWAVVVKATRTEWINWLTIRRTRKEAWSAYVEQWIPEHRPELEKAKRKGGLRLSRVLVTEAKR